MTATPREYEVRARSTDVFGRVLCGARDHHFVVDGPVHNGCPGEELTPPEAFLSGVASCAVELLHVMARDEDVPLERVRVRMRGTIDPERQPHGDVTVFSTVRLDFEIQGADAGGAAALVQGFKRR